MYTLPFLNRNKLKQMTPEEKAKELIGKYRFRLLPFITFQKQLTENDLLAKCKQCAIIAVEEILKSEETAYPNQYIEVGQVFKEFWNQVLTELNK